MEAEGLKSRPVHTKKNETGFADALFREAEGLALLREAVAVSGVEGVRVPEVYSVSEERLEMTGIVSQRQSDRLLRQLGHGLARIHGLPQGRYGFHLDNYIGLNPQKNTESDHWGRFFLEFRLGYQVSLIGDEKIRYRFTDILEQKGTLLTEWLDERCRAPSLLHGDLWSGNVMFDNAGAWLIDPAVYYGDSEADMAMTEMFGGFGPAFYQAYGERRPFSPDYASKREIYNLYHFLNHYNLFGGWYLGPCEKGFGLISRL
ncbi:Fructosamine-3-kinase [Marinobacter daqiaonensis]|uniref:Fructosamine-3-kinase n=1 Tax=Marinobacter daqiaonensis TaxID=650891 RepID=A0A1I6GNI4_9GAMM|nr:fructosamine kinase family protein [Marinobacter daqiaonensis]SFR43617.1 Fructosamine-3-kinase [Marinobacter daqiaonensis]